MQWRGLVKQLTHDDLGARMSKEKMTVYAGFDPSAPSLHVGNLMPLLGLVRAQRAGHRPIVLVGGATGMVGDPSGKSVERNLQSLETIAENTKSIEAQIGRFLDFDDAKLVNNLDWFEPLGYLGFLRDVGKHFSVNAMIAKESVKARLEREGEGISYTEFSYMLIQAYDFLHLFDTEKCTMQLGGSEQWGNITAGIDLIRRMRGGEAFGLTMPLLLDSQGNKLGKSEKGAISLDANLTSVYDFYQYFVRLDDRDVIKTLRFLTLLDKETIDELEVVHAKAPEKREAAKVLAREMTTLVHGAEEATKAEEAAKALFGQASSGGIAPGTPTKEFEASRIADGLLLVDALVECGLAKSKSEARRLIKDGGVYVNGDRVGSQDHTLQIDEVQDGLIRIRKGKKHYFVLKVS